MQLKIRNAKIAVFAAIFCLSTSNVDAAGVLTIGRNEDSTTFDPIKTANNADYWVFSNVFDVLVRVDPSGTKLLPGLAESWTVSEDGTTYTFKLRDAKFSDGSPVTASDAAFSLTRIRDDEGSLWADSFEIIDTATAANDRTLVVKLKGKSVPFISMMAQPNASVLPKRIVNTNPEAFAEKPVGSGAFMVKDWKRGDRIVLKKNPNYWDSGNVSLDGVEWIVIPDDNTRMLNVQTGQIDVAITVPFSRVAEMTNKPDLVVRMDPSTREDHLIMNHEHDALAKREVREALDLAIDKRAIVEAATFDLGEVANSYIPKGALYHYSDNRRRPYDPEKAQEILKAACPEGLTLNYVVSAGKETDEQIAVLVQQQLAKAGVTVNLQKVDPSQGWDMLVSGDYDISVVSWTNDILDPDQKTTFALGHDTNMNFMTRYKNFNVKALVAAARLETDHAKREAMYIDLQKMAKADVNFIDLYYSPYINVMRKNITNFHQNPLGRFFLEDTVKN